MHIWKHESTGTRRMSRYFGAWKAWFLDEPTLGDDQCQTGRLLTDIDRNLGDMALITRVKAGPNVLMPLRLELLGLDASYIAASTPETYRRLREACTSCPSWRRCARDLAAGEPQGGLGTYCSNQPLLDALVLERGDRSSGSADPH